MKLSEDEKSLYAELAVQLAFRMCDSSDHLEGRLSRKDRPDFEGLVISPGLTSDFQDCWLALYNLGILQALNTDLSPREHEPIMAPCYRLKFGTSGLREYATGRLAAGAPTLSKLIEIFLGLVAGYNYGIHTRRDSFSVPPDYERVFELFERCSLVERLGHEVKWTDGIAPEMRAAHAWTEDLISSSEAEDAEAEKMWRTMPQNLRDMIVSAGPVDVLSLVIVISQFWHKGEWRDTALDAGKDEIILREASTGLARKLEEKFRESGG